MIRFVSLHGADTGRCFAFWDTVSDTFVTLFGTQAWRDYADLMECCNASDVREQFVERITNLLPLDIRNGSHVCPEDEP